MKDYYERYWDRESPPPLDDPLATKRAEILWSLISSLEEKPESFLDAGCGAGWLAATASERNMNAIGLDIAGNALDQARKDHPAVRFIAHSVDERPWPIPPASVDIVASFEVIEHLVRPDEFVHGIAETLKVGGHAAISTPYHGMLKNLAISIRGFDKHFDVTGDHIRFFSDRSLFLLLQRHGLEPIKFVHFGRAWGLWAGVMVWAKRVR